MPTPLRAALFDIDGTLVDSNGLHVEAWARAFGEAGHQVAPQAIAKQIGKGGSMLAQALVAGLSDDEADALDERHGAIFKADCLARARPFTGATALIERCAKDGVRVVLASSASREELDHYVRLLGIADALHATTAADDVDTSKPAPDIFAVALDRAGVAAGEAVAIGDSPYDVEAAAKAGVRTIALRSGGYSDADLASAFAIRDDVATLLDEGLARIA